MEDAITLEMPAVLKREKVNPSVDYTKNYNHFASARFIIECGVKLKANILTIASAATYYHRFFSRASLEDYDPYLIGCTCLYVASKVEDDNVKIRDIINVGVSTVRRGNPPLALDPYFAMRDSLVHSELLVMRMLGFKLRVEHPHKYLLHYFQSLEDWLGTDMFTSVPIVDTAWAILQDVFHSSLVIKYSSQLIATAVLHLTLQIYGIVVPSSDEVGPWYSVLHQDCGPLMVSELASKIMLVYKEENDLVLMS